MLFMFGIPASDLKQQKGLQLRLDTQPKKPCIFPLKSFIILSMAM
jgi:hypothetical protein